MVRMIFLRFQCQFSKREWGPSLFNEASEVGPLDESMVVQMKFVLFQIAYLGNLLSSWWLNQPL